MGDNRQQPLNVNEGHQQHVASFASSVCAHIGAANAMTASVAEFNKMMI